jgi:hypothetical protein
MSDVTSRCQQYPSPSLGRYAKAEGIGRLARDVQDDLIFLVAGMGCHVTRDLPWLDDPNVI